MKKTLFTLFAIIALGLFTNVCLAQYVRLEISNHGIYNYDASSHGGPWGTIEQGDVKIAVYTDASCTTLWTSSNINVDIQWVSGHSTPQITTDPTYTVNGSLILGYGVSLHDDHYYNLIPGPGIGHDIYGARPEIVSADCDILPTLYIPR